MKTTFIETGSVQRFRKAVGMAMDTEKGRSGMVGDVGKERPHTGEGYTRMWKVIRIQSPGWRKANIASLTRMDAEVQSLYLHFSGGGMSKRTKPTPEIVANLPQAEGALAEMAIIDRKLAAIESDMNEAIDAAKHFAQRESAPLLDRHKALADAVGTFAALNKAELFGKSRSLDLAFGVIGFRKSAQLAQQTRITSAMTLEKLREYAFTDAIRTKEEVNKAARALNIPVTHILPLPCSHAVR